jgi:hypothetical protein
MLGAFYYVEAVVLLEDIIGKVDAINSTQPSKEDMFQMLGEVSYYRTADITGAYRDAA